MQTIARSMADTGPIEGRYMPHAPPIVGRYGKRPHMDFGRPRLRARVVVPPARQNRPSRCLLLLLSFVAPCVAAPVFVSERRLWLALEHARLGHNPMFE